MRRLWRARSPHGRRATSPRITAGVVQPEQLKLIFDRFENFAGGQMGLEDFAALLTDLGLDMSREDCENLFNHLIETARVHTVEAAVEEDGDTAAPADVKTTTSPKAPAEDQDRSSRRFTIHAETWLPVDETTPEPTINVEQFLAVLRRHAFLRRIVSHYSFTEPTSWSVSSSSYDYSKSTFENYGAPVEAGFVGSLAALRASVDLSWHGNYSKERQRWQEAAVYSVALPGGRPCHHAAPAAVAVDPRLDEEKQRDPKSPKLTTGYLLKKRASLAAAAAAAAATAAAAKTCYGELAAPTARPWLVYTCGAMGAGKGWVMNWMSQREILPLRRIVHVDPDRFKAMMPEWPGYYKRCPATAGSMCHHESGLLAELTQEVAMAQRQHVWVDGSLRDFEWYDGKLKVIRKKFPYYRIALFYVHAPEAVIRDRVKLRAARAGGRDVPEALIADSLAAPAHTLRALTPRVDFIARINNNLDSGPILEAFESVDTSGDWDQIAEKFEGAFHGGAEDSSTTTTREAPPQDDSGKAKAKTGHLPGAAHGLSASWSADDLLHKAPVEEAELHHLDEEFKTLQIEALADAQTIQRLQTDNVRQRREITDLKIQLVNLKAAKKNDGATTSTPPPAPPHQHQHQERWRSPSRSSSSSSSSSRSSSVANNNNHERHHLLVDTIAEASPVASDGTKDDAARVLLLDRAGAGSQA